MFTVQIVDLKEHFWTLSIVPENTSECSHAPSKLLPHFLTPFSYRITGNHLTNKNRDKYFFSCSFYCNFLWNFICYLLYNIFSSSDVLWQILTLFFFLFFKQVMSKLVHVSHLGMTVIEKALLRNAETYSCYETFIHLTVFRWLDSTVSSSISVYPQAVLKLKDLCCCTRKVFGLDLVALKLNTKTVEQSLYWFKCKINQDVREIFFPFLQWLSTLIG